MPRKTSARTATPSYVLDHQVGFLLRQAVQRHLAIFTHSMTPELTPTQFATLAKLYEEKACSQNRLGRLTAMDAATIKGVVDRLVKRGLAKMQSDPKDGRLLMISLTPEGRKVIKAALPKAVRISEKTLSPLSTREQATFLHLLQRLC